MISSILAVSNTLGMASCGTKCVRERVMLLSRSSPVSSTVRSKSRYVSRSVRAGLETVRRFHFGERVTLRVGHPPACDAFECVRCPRVVAYVSAYLRTGRAHLRCLIHGSFPCDEPYSLQTPCQCSA